MPRTSLAARVGADQEILQTLHAGDDEGIGLEEARCDLPPRRFLFLLEQSRQRRFGRAGKSRSEFVPAPTSSGCRCAWCSRAARSFPAGRATRRSPDPRSAASRPRPENSPAWGRRVRARRPRRFHRCPLSRLTCRRRDGRVQPYGRAAGWTAGFGATESFAPAGTMAARRPTTMAVTSTRMIPRTGLQLIRPGRRPPIRPTTRRRLWRYWGSAISGSGRISRLSCGHAEHRRA